MISGYDRTFNWGGSVTVPRKSRVYKVYSPPWGVPRSRWRSQHPVLGIQVFDTWQEAMAHAATRCYMMNPNQSLSIGF